MKSKSNFRVLPFFNLENGKGRSEMNFKKSKKKSL